MAKKTPLKIYSVTSSYTGGKYVHGLYTSAEIAKANCGDDEFESKDIEWTFDEADEVWIGKLNRYMSRTEYMIREIAVHNDINFNR